MKPKIVYWNNIPAPYMIERFNAVEKRGNIEFEAWFNERTEQDRSWEIQEKEWLFKYAYVRAFKMGNRKIRIPPILHKKKKPDLLVSLYAEPVFLVGWMLAYLRRIKTAFWTEVTFDRWIPRNRLKEWAKCRIFPRINGVITVGNDGYKFARKYGASTQQIFFAPHVIDVEHFSRGQMEAYPEREKFRTHLGLKGVTFIYVGRLWWGKGLDYLLEAFKQVQANCPTETSLLLVGDGPEEQHLRTRCHKEKIKNVVFTGFHQKPQLPRYYTAADVFVFPTLGDPYGLVVNEAMACSLPIISTSSAGEIKDRVEEGTNGYIVPPENSTSLSKRMDELVGDATLRKKMGKASKEKITGQTPEKWAEDFEQAIEKILY